jgi:hypothetical protein
VKTGGNGLFSLTAQAEVPLAVIIATSSRRVIIVFFIY